MPFYGKTAPVSQLFFFFLLPHSDLSFESQQMNKKTDLIYYFCISILVPLLSFTPLSQAVSVFAVLLCVACCVLGVLNTRALNRNPLSSLRKAVPTSTMVIAAGGGAKVL